MKMMHSSEHGGFGDVRDANESACRGIHSLVDTVKQWKSANGICGGLYEKFHSIYDVREDVGHLSIPSSFEKKINEWMGNKQEAVEGFRHQTIMVIRNKVTGQETIFNILRQKKPVATLSATELEFVDRLVARTEQDCDFCAYETCTAEDVPFGRIETTHAFTAANAFKLDACNAMIIFRRHNPFDYTEEEAVDGLGNTMRQWCDAIRLHDVTYRYPAVFWDQLPRGGASQIHPHLHVVLTRDKYHGDLQTWKCGALAYQQTHSADYFNTLIEVHSALGLAVRHGSAWALCSLTPIRDNEVVVIGQADDSFYRLLYYVIQAFQVELKKLAFSLAIALPPLDNALDDPADLSIPAFARIVTRGLASDYKSDVCSLELFGASNVNRDPFATAFQLKKYISSREISAK